MNFKGTIRTKKKLNYTEFLFGPDNLIENKELLILETEENTFLCLVSALGAIKVDKRDVKEVNYHYVKNPLNYLITKEDIEQTNSSFRTNHMLHQKEKEDRGCG